MLLWILHVHAHSIVMTRRVNKNIRGQRLEDMQPPHRRVGHLSMGTQDNAQPKASAACGVHSQG